MLFVNLYFFFFFAYLFAFFKVFGPGLGLLFLISIKNHKLQQKQNMEIKNFN